MIYAISIVVAVVVTYVIDAQDIAVTDVCMETAHLTVVLQIMFIALDVQMVTIWVPVTAAIVAHISNVNVSLIMAALDVFLGTLIRVFIAKKVALVTVLNVQALPTVPNVLLENTAYPVS